MCSEQVLRSAGAGAYSDTVLGHVTAAPSPTGTAAKRQIFQAAALAVLVAVLLVLFDLARTSTNPLNLVQPGVQGPSVEVFQEDFPQEELLSSTGLDGQQFYAVARNPFRLNETAEHLDRPRYRLQRPLLSWLAWLGRPTGGGTGLIWSLFAVNVLATGVLALSSGFLSIRLGGPPWVAALVGLYPGVWWSMRVTVADGLATGLALAALALAAHQRTRWAVVAGIAAALAKETAVLMLLGWALSRWRDRVRWYPFAGAVVVAGAWALFLRIQLPGDETVAELTLPLTGLWGAVTERWLEGDELWGLLGTATGLGVAIAALARRGMRHPLGPAIALQLAFLSFANDDVLGNDFGSARAFLPALALGVVALFAPGSQEPEHASSGDSEATAVSHAG